jgi:uncharacterized protein YacL
LKTFDPKQVARPGARSAPGAWPLRAALLLAFALASAHFQPLGLSPLAAGALGAVLALVAVLCELDLERASLRRLIGGTVGALAGLLAALLVSLVLSHTAMATPLRSFASMAALLVLAFLGLAVGAEKGDLLNLEAFGGVFHGEPGREPQCKVLDTSVIIDGRIADICEAQFLDGTLLVPQFVLRELQMVADSSDPLKRQRGRRGLDVLQRMQKLTGLHVEIAEEDFPNIPDVDMKLIELAKRCGAKILTNDYNLNKVATLQGYDVLNINQLANALKPVVLPGEPMRVFILREGKEYNQGVAYLDDGTMVVVDGARRFINKTVDVLVTSVHQTSAGKMIFGKLDDHIPQNAHAGPAATAQNAGEASPPRAANGETRPAENHSASEHAPRPVFPQSGRS